MQLLNIWLNLDIDVAIEFGGCCLRTIDDFTGDFLRIL